MNNEEQIEDDYATIVVHKSGLVLSARLKDSTNQYYVSNSKKIPGGIEVTVQIYDGTENE